MQKGHSCRITVALSTRKCGPFRSSMGTNEQIGGLFRCSEAGFSFWLENFDGYDFVHIIRRHPVSSGGTFHRFLPVCGQYIYSFPQPAINHPGFCQSVYPVRRESPLPYLIVIFKTLSTEGTGKVFPTLLMGLLSACGVPPKSACLLPAPGY